jgi:DNA-binding NarL/FixJ family response regulator
LQHFYAEFYRQFSRPNGNDLVREFLVYIAIRDRLQMSQPLTDADAEYFESHHVRPAEQFNSSFEALERLERELPISFPDLARDADFIIMLRSLADAPDFERLRNHVQSRPAVGLDIQLEPGRALRTFREWQELMGLQVMWINDYPLVIERDAEELKRAGAIVIECGSTGEAREHLPSFRPDVLISDISRHGDDSAGFRDLEVLTDEGLYAGPVVFYTARITPSRRSRAMSLGASITSSRSQLFDLLVEIATTTASFEHPSAFLAREQRTILEMLVAGDPLEAVASRLGTGEEHVLEVVSSVAARWRSSKDLDAADRTLIEAAIAAKIFERFGPG